MGEKPNRDESPGVASQKPPQSTVGGDERAQQKGQADKIDRRKFIKQAGTLTAGISVLWKKAIADAYNKEETTLKSAQETAETVTVQEVTFDGPPDLSRNTPKNIKAAETPQIMFSVVLCTQNSKPILDAYNALEGKNVIDYTQTSANQFKQYCENSGFKKLDIQVIPEIIEIDPDVYPDTPDQSLKDANVWSHNSLNTPGSWLYNKREEIAQKYSFLGS